MTSFKQFFFKALYIISLLDLFSCTNKQKNELTILTALNESLETSNKTINNSTVSQLKVLEDKKTEWATADKATAWLTKAELITAFTKNRYNFIEKKKAVSNFTNIEISDIYKNALAYKNEVLDRDPELNKEFESDFLFINKFIGLICSDTSLASLSLKKDLTPPFIEAAISSLQNEIKKIENKTITFCNMKVGSNIDYFDSYSLIVGQNSNIINSGEKLEITAGVGAFSKSAMPKIIINKKLSKINDEGYTVYKIKTGTKPGKYYIPVKIDFINPNTGKKEVHELNVEYTVAKPCN